MRFSGYPRWIFLAAIALGGFFLDWLTKFAAVKNLAYGQPVPCAKCGHTHYPGQDVCPYCGDRCQAGGNDLDPDTVYTQRRLPGQYWYEKQPHYRFSAPMRLRGTYLKYKWPYD